jgi:hypothetical protein
MEIHMKRSICCSLIVLFLAAFPAQAQILRRPLVQQIIRSPFVNELVNFGVSQFLPGFPHILSLPPVPATSGTNTPILVDSSVRGNLDRTAKNLSDTDDIMKALLDKNKVLVDKASEKKPDAKTDEKKAASVTDLEQRLIDLTKRFEAQTEELGKLKKLPAGAEGIDFEAVRKFFEEKAAADKKKKDTSKAILIPIGNERLMAKIDNTPVKVELTEAVPEEWTLNARRT